MATREEQVAMNRQGLEKMCVQIQSECPLAKHVRYECSSFYPNICFITVDALNPQDYPNNIAENSIFITFRIDLAAKVAEYNRSGHVYLSPKEKRENPKLRYLCMHGMSELARRLKHVNRMRRYQYKDGEAAAHKMATYFNKVMETVVDYTDGYPYKQGVEK